jgi:hypothetical protein
VGGREEKKNSWQRTTLAPVLPRGVTECRGRRRETGSFPLNVGQSLISPEKWSGLSVSSPPLPGVMLTRRVAAENLGAGPVTTEMVHGRARATSRQTLRVAANEVRSRVTPADRGHLVLFTETGISKRDMIAYS